MDAMRGVWKVFLSSALAVLSVSTPAPSTGAPPSKPAKPDPSAKNTQAQAFCHGEYADSLLALAPQSRAIEQDHYSYCVRNTATYECLSYSGDGNVRRSR